jgi:hypothetical protein
MTTQQQDQLWRETIQCSAEWLSRLDQYIRDPARPQVFYARSFEPSSGRRVDVVIKHDLFEGVVLNVTLLEDQGQRFLGGTNRTLDQARDILGTDTVSTHDAQFSVTWVPSSS